MPKQLPVAPPDASSAWIGSIRKRDQSPSADRAERIMPAFPCRPPRLTLHEAFLPANRAPPNGFRRGGDIAAGIHVRRASGSRRKFLFNPDILGPRPVGRAFGTIRERVPPLHNTAVRRG